MTDTANRRSGFGNTLEMGRRPALLVVDFQRGFTESALSVLASDCSGPIDCVNRLIRLMRPEGSIIYTVCSYTPGLHDAGPWIQKCPTLGTLVRGTEVCELDPRLEYDPEADLILHKTQASAFYGTPLAGILAARQIDTLVIGGCTTSGCVRASAVDAMQYGFLPFVVRDACADRSKAQHDSNLTDLADKYAEVVDIENAAGLLSK